MSTHDPVFSVPYRVASLPARKVTRFDIQPDVAERAAIAADLGLLGITELRLKGELRPAGQRDWTLAADLTAEVTQPCVVTLAPVLARIAEPVLRRYLSDMPEPEGDEVEMTDESAEPLPQVIDAGEVLVEALALALPPYPRAEGVAFEGAAATAPGAAPLPDETARRPFAGLADLLRKAEGEA